MLPIQPVRRVDQRRQMPRRLAAPASGEHHNQWTAPGQSVFLKKFVARERRPHQAGQGVADIGRLHPFAPEEVLFKGKDAQKMPQGAAHFAQPAFPPCPSLRSHQIDHRNTRAMQAPGHAEVKIRRIRKNRQVGPLAPGGAQQLAILPVDPRDVRALPRRAPPRPGWRHPPRCARRPPAVAALYSRKIRHRAGTGAVRPLPGRRTNRPTLPPPIPIFSEAWV